MDRMLKHALIGALAFAGIAAASASAEAMPMTNLSAVSVPEGSVAQVEQVRFHRHHFRRHFRFRRHHRFFHRGWHHHYGWYHRHHRRHHIVVHRHHHGLRFR